MTYKPSNEQQAVIDSTAPALLVLAGAGTGKTITAAAAARRYLEPPTLSEQRSAAQPSSPANELAYRRRRARSFCRSPVPLSRRSSTALVESSVPT